MDATSFPRAFDGRKLRNFTHTCLNNVNKPIIIHSRCYFDNSVLYENIDQILPNKLHGPMHYKIGVTCVYSGHVF